MELQSCSLFGRCRDRNTGKLTKISLLHRDLIGLGKILSAFTRLKANEAFYLSQSPKFLDRYSEDLIFTSEDADAEPKLASFFEVAKRIMPEVRMEDIRTLLAKKFKEGVYSFDEAYNKMASFNLQMDGGNSFIGTLVPQQDGKYMFKIVPNSALELEALIQVIADRNNAESIIKHLENLGVGILDGVRALYNSKNPAVLSKGLLGLITLRGGKEAAAYHIKDLASETGHTIVGMLGEDNKLYQRLKKVILEHPEVAKELLGASEYAAYADTKDATKEFMGHIVGLYLEQWDNIKPNTKLRSIGTLILRMVDWISSKLHFTNRDYYSALYNAKWTAYNMVKDFMGNNFQGSLDNALSNGGEFLLGDKDIVFQKLTDVLQKMSVMVESSKDFGYTAHKNYRNIFHDLVSKHLELNLLMKEFPENVHELYNLIEPLSASAVLNLVNFLSNEMVQTKELLDNVIKGVTPSGEPIELASRAKAIKYAQEVLNMCNIVLSLLESFLYIMRDDLKEEINRVFKALQNAVNIAAPPADNSGAYTEKTYQRLINEAREKIALELLVQVNGRDFIAIGLHVKFKDWSLVRKDTSIKSMLELLNHNITSSFISRFIDSIADNPDIVNQLIYDVIELKKHEANIKTLDIKDLLFQMYRELRELGIKDTRVFYETDSLGHLTGNLISERNWGEWERLYKQDKKEWEDKYYEANKGLFPSKADMYNNNMFLEAFGAWREGWHSLYSVKIELKDEDGNTLKYKDGKAKKRWAPVIDTDKGYQSKAYNFANPQWEELQKNKKAVAWLNKYMKLKRELDDMLPDGSTNAAGVRAPLFMGTTTDRFTNAFKGDGKIKRVLNMSLRRYVIHNIAASPDDTEYGGENDSYNKEDLYTEGSLIFTRAHSNALKSIERVPVYGVRKLPSMDDLSTDLIQSTLAYAAMATSYNSLNEVADVAVQIGEYRHSKGIDESPTSTFFGMINLPTGYHRLADYLLQLVYNNYASPYLGLVSRSFARATRKIAGSAARLGSVWMLGFNMHSAITNAYTGFNEIWKEAHSGEEFNKRDFMWAFGKFWYLWHIGFLQNWCNIALKKGSIIESTTKMDLFFRRFDVLNENERKFRDYHIQTRGWGITKGWSGTNVAMLPYSITDQWMQGISFLATARHTKLKNKVTNEECSLWNAYKVVEEEGKEPKLVLKGNPKDWTIYDKNQARLNEVLSKKAKDGIELTSAESRAIYQFEEVPLIDKATGQLRRDAAGRLEFRQEIKVNPDTGEYMLIDPYVPFDSRLENRFRLRCRAINNRMHGVYNRGDGGAFQKLAIASMAASMKKYAIGLIDRRFSFSRYDARTGEMRQGSTVTMGLLLWDCFTCYSSGDDSKIINFLDSMKYSDYYYVLGTAGKLLWGISKFMYLTTFGALHPILGVDKYLRKRGYSLNQIANTRRFFGDIFRPMFVDFMMSLFAPPIPDDDEEQEDESLLLEAHGALQTGVDAIFDNSFTDWISDKTLSLYIAAVKVSLFGADATVSDDDILTKDYLNYIVAKRNKYEGAKAFSLKPIIYYQLYRASLEQKAYAAHRPLSMFLEYKGLMDAMLPGFTAMNDMVMTASLLAQNVSEEELAEMSEKDAGKYYDGKEIYERGDNKYWYKWSKKLLKVGPLRSAETWFNGYAAYESMKHYKEPFSKEKYQEGVFNINRR